MMRVAAILRLSCSATGRRVSERQQVVRRGAPSPIPHLSVCCGPLTLLIEGLHTLGRKLKEYTRPTWHNTHLNLSPLVIRFVLR